VGWLETTIAPDALGDGRGRLTQGEGAVAAPGRPDGPDDHENEKRRLSPAAASR